MKRKKLSNRPFSLHSINRVVGQNRLRLLLVAGVFAVGGYMLLQSTRAATYTVSAEAESAALSGRALLEDVPNASGGKAVSFDGPLTDVQVFTGGDSIAIRWDRKPGSIYSPGLSISYELYRNGTLLKKFENDQGYTHPELVTNNYIDTNVTKSTSYSYQVRMLRSDGFVTPLSKPITVTHPTSGYPTPTVTVGATGTAELATEMNTKIVPFVKIWYPKLGKLLSNGQFTPDNTLKISFGTKAPNGKDVINVWTHWYVNGTPEVIINPTFYRSTTMGYIYSTIIAGFVVADGRVASQAPEWVLYSADNWIRYGIFRDQNFLEPTYAIYGGRYDGFNPETGQFMEWLRLKYGPAVLPMIIKAVAYNTYTDAVFQQATGKTLAQLQAEWQPTSTTKGPVALKFAAYPNKCLDATGTDAVVVESRPHLKACSGVASQQFSIVHQSDPAIVLLRTGKFCVFIHPVTKIPNMFGCVGQANSAWKQNANGTLESAYYTGQCLETPGGSTATTALTLAPCDGTDKQRFTPIP